MLLSLILIPLFGSLVLLFTEKTSVTFIRNFSLFWSLFILNSTLILLFLFDSTSSDFQFIENYS